MKKTKAIFFSHDANAQNDEKIINLRVDLGWEGYGLYFAVLELMCCAKSNYSLRLNYKAIAFTLKSTEQLIKKVVNDYDLFVIKNDFIISKSFLKRMKIKNELTKKRSIVGKIGGESSMDNQSTEQAKGKQNSSKSDNLLKQKVSKFTYKTKQNKTKQNKTVVVVSKCDAEKSSTVIFPLSDKTTYSLPLYLFIQYQKTYTSLNLDQEFEKMRSWLLSNNKNLKTVRGMPKFINNWLNRTVTGFDNKPVTKVKEEPSCPDFSAKNLIEVDCE